jgi:hypothetical protein
MISGVEQIERTRAPRVGSRRLWPLLEVLQPARCDAEMPPSQNFSGRKKSKKNALTRIVQPYSWEIATRELCADAGFPAIGVVLRSWASCEAAGSRERAAEMWQNSWPSVSGLYLTGVAAAMQPRLP